MRGIPESPPPSQEKPRERTITKRINFFSKAFLNRPYLDGALGEGEKGEFDQNPLYRTDFFDCVTYVNTVLALSLSETLEDFKKNIVKINYRHAKPIYENRHHFMSIDWNRENEDLGIIEEITDQLGMPVQIAEAIIDRGSFFRHKPLSAIKSIHKISREKETELLSKLHALGDQFKPEKSTMKYISLEDIFHESLSPEGGEKEPLPPLPLQERAGVRGDNILHQMLPELSLAQMIRPNWNLQEKIGTNLNVSHLGFVFNRENNLIFRHATSLQGKVLEVDFLEYLASFKNHPTLKGVNFFRLIPGGF